VSLPPGGSLYLTPIDQKLPLVENIEPKNISIVQFLMLIQTLLI